MVKYTALALILLASQALASINQPTPDTHAKPEAKPVYRLRSSCTDAKPREIIRLRMFKMDKDGRLVEVRVVLIPKGC